MPQPDTLEEQFDESHNCLMHAGAKWTGQPYVFLDDEGVEIAAGDSDRPDRGISVSHKFGTQITGPMSSPKCRKTSALAAGIGA